MSPPESSPPAPKPRRRWLRWVKRGALGMLMVIVLLVVFHRPLLRWSIAFGAKKFADSSGLTFAGRVGGSVLGGLALDEWEMAEAGGEITTEGPVRRLSWSKLALDYDLWALRRGGPGTVLQRLVLHDAEVDLDLRVPPEKQKPKKEKDPSEPAGSLPRVTLPELDLRNVNAHIVMEDNEITVRGFTLTWRDGAPGEFQLDELELAASGFVVRDLRGVTEKQGDVLVLRDFSLPHDTHLDRLRLDLTRLHDGLLPLELRVGRGEFAAALQADVSGLPAEPEIKATLGVSQFTPPTLAGWVTLPETITWDPVALKLEIAGLVLHPRQLTGGLDLTAGSVTVPSVKLDSTTLNLGIADGRVTLRDSQIKAGQNVLALTGNAALPETWAEAAQLGAEVELVLNAPAVQEFFSETPPVTGAAHGTIRATLVEGKPGPFQADLTATQLGVAGREVASVEVKATGTTQRIDLTSLLAKLDDINVLQAEGSLGLEGDQPLELKWSLDFQNVAAALPGGPESGHLEGQGTVSGKLKELTAQDFSTLEADVGLTLKDLAWQQGRLQQAIIDAGVSDGRVQVRQADIFADDRNRLSLTAEAELAGERQFSAKLSGDLLDLPRLSGWAELAKAPALQSGRVAIDWEGRGNWKDFAVEGGGQVRVENVRLQGKPEVLAVQLTTTHAGQKAELSQLIASWGDLRVEARGSASPATIELPHLSVSQGTRRLVQGNVSIPLYTPPPAPPPDDDPNALVIERRDPPPPKPKVPLDPTRPLKVDLVLDELDATALFGLVGQKPPVSGRFNAALHVSGQWPAPILSLKVTATGVQAAAMEKKLAPANLDLDVSFKDNRLSLQSTAVQPPLQPLKTTASLPLDLQKVIDQPQTLMDAPIQAAVTLPRSDLGFLTKLVPALAKVAGHAQIDLQANGPLKAPHAEGEVKISLSDVDFTTENLPEVRDTMVHLTVRDRQVAFTEVKTMLAGGQVTLGGTANWETPGNPAFDLTLRAEDALVMRDATLSLRTNLDLACRGTLEQGEVTGRIDLVRGRVFKEIEFLPLSLPNQLPPPPASALAGSSAPPAAPPPFDRWRLDLAIRTRDQIRLLGNIMNGGVNTDLRLHGTGAQPVLEGKVMLEQTRLRLPFSRLAINRGEVTFTKDRPFEPVLDVSGDSYVGGYWVNLQAYGSAFDPKIRFSSSPPLPEGEIATLLATGATTGDLAGSEGEAANRAAFLLITQTYRKLFRKGGMPRKYDDEAPKLSFNFSVLDSGSSKRGVSAVYELTPKWQAVGTMSARGTFRGLLYYLVRFR